MNNRQLPAGTTGTFEHRLSKSKVEYVDATLTGYHPDGRVIIETFNGRSYTVSPDRFTPDAESVESMEPEHIDELPSADPWPQFPQPQPESIA